MLQASEGGSVSVGNQKVKVKVSVTPPPVVTPPPMVKPSSAAAATRLTATRLEGTPVAMPVNVPTERIARAPSSRFSTLAAATDKIVVSKNVLIGLCLTTFAFGIVTTLAVDRIHARASETPAPRESEPVVLKTTPIEPDVKAATAAAPAPDTTSQAPAAPAAQAATAPAAQAPSAPAAQAPSAPAEATPAAEAVVVQLPPANETAPRMPIRPSSPPRAVRQAAAAPVRAAPTPRKHAGAAVESDPTEAAPDDGPLPAPVKKKWVDPFDE